MSLHMKFACLLACWDTKIANSSPRKFGSFRVKVPAIIKTHLHPHRYRYHHHTLQHHLGLQTP